MLMHFFSSSFLFSSYVGRVRLCAGSTTPSQPIMWSPLTLYFPNKLAPTLKRTWFFEFESRPPPWPVLADEAQEEAEPRRDPRAGPDPRRLGPEQGLKNVPTRIGTPLVGRRVQNPGDKRQGVQHRQLHRDGGFRHTEAPTVRNLRHRQRRHLDPVPAVRVGMLPAAAAALRPLQIDHLPKHLLQLPVLLGSRHFGCSGSTCLYAVQYGDNSYTVGFFAQDTLTLTSSDVVPNFRFGCGQKNNGLFGTAAGLVGLGRQSASLVSQTSSKYGGVFSYCLPASSSGTGYLTFGPVSAGNVQYTPMLTDSSQPSFYFLGLNDIGVGGQGLSLSPTLFSNAGVIIDSGTVITRLPPTAYTALRTAFRKQMANYPLSSPASILDTCYDFSTYQTVKIPTVAFAFKGATVNLDVSGIMYVASSTQACLAFAANGDDTDIVIIGNTQQKKFNVVYDVSKKQIGFGTGAC
ncbi:aspartyl protease family protein-like [Iris pallida]|uniref:Aspartyl protease family protein-like n=1 Tax=Iris pallida TaxID=29817 RepID=A0AAX6GKT7_IRIPA|nr:aspartyl protease family protein-like [Iris pallida]